MTIQRIAAASLAVLLASICLPAAAKLPPPTPEALAKAAEAKAKSEQASKQAAEQISRYQDRAVENWRANAKARGMTVAAPTPVSDKAVLPAGGTVTAADKAIPSPAEAASTSRTTNAQPAQAGGVARDSAGGAGAPIVTRQ